MKYLYAALALIGLYYLRIVFDKIGNRYSVKLKSKDTIEYTKYEKRFALILLTIVLALIICLFIFLENIMDAVYLSILIFGPMAMGCLILTIHRYNWNVHIDQDKVIYRNSIGKINEYSLKELEYKYNDCNYQVFYNDKKVISVPLRYQNAMILANKLFEINAKLRT